MRYCVLGGIMWTMIYSTCALVVAVAARYRSWNIIHENIPRYKLFLLTDAHDLEGEKGWARCKTAIMAGSILTCVILISLSWIFINQTWSSFAHFIGIIWALYYLINLFMSCKPYALIALWTDTIPPPGKNATAHSIAKDALKAKGLYKSKRDLGLNPVGGMLDIATGVALDNDNDIDSDHDPNDTQIQMTIQSEDEMSNDDNDDDDGKLDKSPISVESSVPSNPSMNAPRPMINDDDDDDDDSDKDENTETIVTDNLRSVKSTKRILKENKEDNIDEEEEEEKEEPKFVKLSSGISDDITTNGTTRINSVSRGEAEMIEKQRKAKQYINYKNYPLNIYKLYNIFDHDSFFHVF